MEPLTLWIAALVVGSLCLAIVSLYLSLQPPRCGRCETPMVAVADVLIQTFPPVRQREFGCPACGSHYAPRPTVDLLD